MLLAQQGCEVLDLSVVADTVADLGQCLARAREHADLVVCTGGGSVGEEDHVRPVLERLGRISFHGVVIKPGKPFALGWLGAASQAHGCLIIDADTHVEEGHVYGCCPGTQFLD